MKFLSLIFVLATGVTAVVAQEKDKIAPQPIVLTGCVAAGEKPNTFVLTDIVAPPAAPTPIGTSGIAAPAPTPTPFYWFENPDALKPHVGHKVQITGTLDDDVDKTKVKSEDGKVSMETERTKKVEIREGTPAAAKLPADGAKHPTYKVTVKSVKAVEGSCS
jgi:hypothetical protein